MNVFSLNQIVWAMELKGVSPLLRTVALYLADQGRWASDDPDDFADGSNPPMLADIAAGAEWVGCDQPAFLTTVLALRPHGVALERVAGGEVVFRLPELRPPAEPSTKREVRERQISIYVMSVPAGSIKIGISVDPAYRLYTLQCSNPLMKLTLEFQAAGPSSKIRAIEREAHKHFADRAIGNEWFAVPTAEAVAAIVHLMENYQP